MLCQLMIFAFLFLLTLDKALHFRNKGVDDFVRISGMRSLTAFTVCLWMSSSDSQGSPFSYAVSGQNNELLIYYNKYFELNIGGESRYRENVLNVCNIYSLACFDLLITSGISCPGQSKRNVPVRLIGKIMSVNTNSIFQPSKEHRSTIKEASG